jgi:hypothetical protein
VCFDRNIYNGHEIDENIINQVHSFWNAYQSHHSTIQNYDIVYESAQMYVYCDATWVGNIDDCQFTLAFSLWGNGAIIWNSKNQPCIIMPLIN